MSQVSDLVKDSKLPTKVDSEYTTHTFLESTSVAGRRARRREREEIWKKKRPLGIGILSTVWLEECVSEDGSKLRAVKEVCKTAPGAKLVDYNRELEAIARFSQQRYDGCFVKSSGWFDTPESVLISMEYLSLGDLQQYMTQPFPEKEAQHIALQLLEGLDFMHGNGFAHRDLKPQNIFVLSMGPDWWVKIGDFGISKRVMESFMGLSTFNGTPAFIAPEVYEQQWKIEKTTPAPDLVYGPAVDIWALGVITYYMLTANLPFSWKSDLLAYSKGEADLPLSSLAEVQVSPEATSFLERLLAAKSADRPVARDALDHAWLVPLLQDSDASDGQDQPEPISNLETIQEPEEPQEFQESPAPKQKPPASQDVMVPGTIDLTDDVPEKPKKPIPAEQHPSIRQSQQSTTPISPLSLGIDGDTYKQLINNLNLNRSRTPSTSVSTRDYPATETASIATSQQSDSQHSEPITRAHHNRQTSSASSMTPIDILPPYTRRRSDAAPIPISDLDYKTPSSGSPTPSIRNSRHSADRFSEKIRRASRDIMPRRSRRSNDYHGKDIKEAEIPRCRSSQDTTPTSPST
ncbi:hypothetical protein NUU61_006620 [Penicillium alfredii]|uniref:Serine/threonine-protein kinase ATG1 n=1 Tax=Penicillium alfredii TaxID=1506179 RepID=A0A9W9F1G5_9EURO|nr:uncharacterized protein NUU61_006620 [Penicillium alfredii]KAJ5091750.1 hypothetical protein NUU61_006620 [Penicillium alfredii]